MAEHSPIGASSAHRWFECPGSIKLIEQAPPQESSVYAIQGTAAHWVLEQCLDNDEGPTKYLGVEAPNGYVIETEDVDAVAEALNIISEEIGGEEYELYTEVRFDLAVLYPNLFGTADVVMYHPKKKIIKIIDYKHGKGIPVRAHENKQLLYYGLGAINWLAERAGVPIGTSESILDWGDIFDEIWVGIIQPRIIQDDSDRMWQVPKERINSFAKELKEKAKATAQPNAYLSAGEHCRWCPALAICPQPFRATSEIIKQDMRGVSAPENLSLPRPASLRPDELSKIMKFSDFINDWLKEIRKYAHGQLESGKTVPGFKLVKRKANRKWVDEDEALAQLEFLLKEEEIHTEPKLRSPAQIEKELGRQKHIIADLSYTPDNGTTIVPQYDRRKAIETTPEDFFDNEE